LHGRTAQLTATVSENNDSYVIEWSSSNSLVATVNENGFVLTHSLGSALLTAKVIGSEQHFATCLITVSNEITSIRSEKELQKVPGKISIYPNPVNGLLNLEFQGRSENMDMSIYDSMGKLIYSSPVYQNTCKLQLQLPDHLKNGVYFGKDYFRELLERIRSIRASERRVYQQITDIFAECSIDYDPQSELTHNFYAAIQNKFHYAITGKTAAEIVYESADKVKPYMGLTNWKNSPKGRILKSDVSIAKNYLTEDEIKKLEKAISGYFDYIERLIERHIVLTMENLSDSVNKFLEFNEYEILGGKGTISHYQAANKAIEQYDEYNRTHKIESDFDRILIKVFENENDDE
jgi:hypothetical protein